MQRSNRATLSIHGTTRDHLRSGLSNAENAAFRKTKSDALWLEKY
jgi:hypothetical protein